MSSKRPKFLVDPTTIPGWFIQEPYILATTSTGHRVMVREALLAHLDGLPLDTVPAALGGSGAHLQPYEEIDYHVYQDLFSDGARKSVVFPYLAKRLELGV